MEIYENLSIESLPNEEWRDIVGYEGLYQISSLGRIKRLVSPKCKKERLLAITKDLKHDYCRVMLSKENKARRFLIHRLLAEHFIPNPENKPCIDHINGIRDDNRLENLRWCTHLENNSFPLAKRNNSIAHKELAQDEQWRKKNIEAVKRAMARPEVRKRISESRKKNWLDPQYLAIQKERHFKKAVLQFSFDMELLNEFVSVNEASRNTGINNSSIIRCCKGRQKMAGNYIWRYKNDAE